MNVNLIYKNDCKYKRYNILKKKKNPDNMFLPQPGVTSLTPHQEMQCSAVQSPSPLPLPLGPE